MEEKVYKKQVSKQALSARVIDAQTPDNQFTISEKSELLTFNDQDEVEFEVEEGEGEEGEEGSDDDDSEYNNNTTNNTNTTNKSSNKNSNNKQQQPTATTTNNNKLKTIKRAMKLLSSGVRDEVLLELVRNYQSIIHSIEDQGSLLKDNEEARLSEEEQMQADAELELELRNEEAGRNPVTSVPSVLVPGLTGVNNSSATGNSNMPVPTGSVVPGQSSSTGIPGSLSTGQNYDPSVFGGNPVLAPGFFQRLQNTVGGGGGGGTATPSLPSPRPATAVSATGPPGSITRPSAAMAQPTTSATTNAQFRPVGTTSSVPPTTTATSTRSAPTVASAQPNPNNSVTNNRPPASAAPISVNPPTTTNRTTTTTSNPANPTPNTATGNPNSTVPANPSPGLPAGITQAQLTSFLERHPEKIPTVRRILDSQTMSQAEKQNAMSALIAEANNQ